MSKTIKLKNGSQINFGKVEDKDRFYGLSELEICKEFLELNKQLIREGKEYIIEDSLKSGGHYAR